MLSENKLVNRLRHLRLFEELFVQGLMLTVVLLVFQSWLIDSRISFISYMPPIGFGLLLTVTYFVQPLAIGVINIILINALHKTSGWQVGFWLNGVFLLLVFSTLNLLLDTVFRIPFWPHIIIIDLLLSFPFGCIARFSNSGLKKQAI